jgi:CRP/FNR family transcriptional regulator
MTADPLAKLLNGTGSCGCCDLDDRAFCAGLGPEGMASLQAIRGNLRVDAHVTLFREGDPALNVYSVVGGALKLSKLLGDGRRQVVGFLFPGDFFGFAPGDAYPVTAETITPTALCRFGRARLARLRQETPALEQRLMARMVFELAAAQEQMLLLGRMSAREKLAHFLIMLSRRNVERGEPPAIVAVPMGRLDVADYLGLTIETVSRTLTAMKKEGLIALPAVGIVDLRDLAGLRGIAEGHGGT